jgi:sulfide dehydrogenase cytochrome subunit
MRVEMKQEHVQCFIPGPTSSNFPDFKEHEMKVYLRSLLVPVVVIGLSLAGYVSASDIATLVETCVSCHGKDGANTESGIPIIGGMSTGYIEYNLSAYQKKERPCPDDIMCGVAKDLSDSDISQLAKFFAGKKFVRAVQSFDPELAKKGKAIHQENCEKCHSNDGSEAKDDAGFLAGQWTPYLRKTFQEYSTGKRHMEQKMKPKIQKLDNDGFEALLNYYASFK